MSTNPRIYLDFNATAPLSAAAREAIAGALAVTGNPSSIHAEGRQARDLVERARNQVAILAGRPREQIVFTSGGTEGNSLGVLGLAAVVERRGGPRVVVTTAIEHPSLRGPIQVLAARGWEIRGGGPARLDNGSIAGAGLVAIAAVNHELGTIADLPTIAAAARAAGALLHVDAVQAAGKLALGEIEADTLVVSAHKLGGPAGSGALAITLDDALPLLEAGHQERGRRPGTENVLGIVGFGAVAATVDVAGWAAVAVLGDRLEAGLRALDGVRIHGAGALRIGGTVNAGFAGARGESLVVALDLEGIATSTGAACTSGSVQPSPVLLGLGLAPEQAREAVRFSLGRSTTRAEVEHVLACLPALLARARAYAPRRA
ncbi:MAG: cysteine desulfurase [Myxococcota bacterium]|nr:cysteine desulfurase [Myxococcota bacterium]